MSLARISVEVGESVVESERRVPVDIPWEIIRSSSLALGWRTGQSRDAWAERGGKKIQLGVSVAIAFFHGHTLTCQTSNNSLTSCSSNNPL